MADIAQLVAQSIEGVKDEKTGATKMAEKTEPEQKKTKPRPKSGNSPQPKAKPKKHVPTQEEIDEKLTLTETINDYLDNERYGPYLKKRGFKAPPKNANLEKLRELLCRLKRAVRGKNNKNFVDTTLKVGMRQIERLAQFVSKNKLLLAGTTESCFNNEVWLDHYHAVLLEMKLPNPSPKVSLLLTTAQIGYQTHVMNSVRQLGLDKEINEQESLWRDSEEQCDENSLEDLSINEEIATQPNN